MEFPSASNLVVKPKEEFISLINVLDLIKIVANRGEYEVILDKDLSPTDKAFLELKGYQVSPSGKEFGPKVSWPKPEVSKPAPPAPKLHLDELIDLVDKAIDLKKGSMKLRHPIFYDTFRDIQQAFPGYHFGGEPTIMDRPYINWSRTVQNGDGNLPPSEFVNFRNGVESAIRKSPEKGSKEYGIAALIPDKWLQYLSAEFSHLLFSLVVRDTGKKMIRVLRWHPKPTETLGSVEPTTEPSETDLIEKIIYKLGLYPPIGRLILNRGLKTAYNTESLRTLLSFCEFIPQGIPQVVLTLFLGKIAPFGTSAKIPYLFEGDFSGNPVEAEKIRQEFIKILEKEL